MASFSFWGGLEDSKRISIALFIGIPAFRAAWQLAPIGAIFQRQKHYEASMYLRITQVLILSLLKQLSRTPPLLVLSPTRVYTENKIRTTALVGVFTNKRLCKKQLSRTPPLLVFSPTRVYTENKIRTSALVGVFTNKRLYRKQIPHQCPCWCFHQQASMQKTIIANTALVGVFTNKRLYVNNTPTE